mmetsp:Transcript_16524/g.40901  ORF Transcript_16524/g.40901 Transcript_16524/m.40901 type:complete len:238 (-) Transcript_16524:384-1097(-)
MLLLILFLLLRALCECGAALRRPIKLLLRMHSPHARCDRDRSRPRFHHVHHALHLAHPLPQNLPLRLVPLQENSESRGRLAPLPRPRRAAALQEFGHEPGLHGGGARSSLVEVRGRGCNEVIAGARRCWYLHSLLHHIWRDGGGRAGGDRRHLSLRKNVDSRGSRNLQLPTCGPRQCCRCSSVFFDVPCCCHINLQHVNHAFFVPLGHRDVVMELLQLLLLRSNLLLHFGQLVSCSS